MAQRVAFVVVTYKSWGPGRAFATKSIALKFKIYLNCSFTLIFCGRLGVISQGRCSLEGVLIEGCMVFCPVYSSSFTSAGSCSPFLQHTCIRQHNIVVLSRFRDRMSSLMPDSHTFSSKLQYWILVVTVVVGAMAMFRWDLIFCQVSMYECTCNQVWQGKPVGLSIIPWY